MEPNDPAQNVIYMAEDAMVDADYINKTPLSEIITNRLLLEILKELRRH